MKLRLFLTILLAFTFFLGHTQNSFEGEILLRNFRNYSNEVLKMNPSVCNGVDTLSLIVKGDKGYIKDYRNQLVTICDGNVYKMYSLSDGTGIKCPYVRKDVLPDNILIKTDKEQIMHDQHVKLYVSNSNAQIGMELQAWITENTMGINKFILSVLSNGLSEKGVPMKFVMSVNGTFPMYMCQEILNIETRSVSDSEFDIPENIMVESIQSFDNYKYKNEAMSLSEKHSNLDTSVLRFGDFTSDFMQRHPASIYPSSTKTYAIDEEWDF